MLKDTGIINALIIRTIFIKSALDPKEPEGMREREREREKSALVASECGEELGPLVDQTQRKVSTNCLPQSPLILSMVSASDN